MKGGNELRERAEAAGLHFAAACDGERITRFRMFPLKEIVSFAVVPLLVVISVSSGDQPAQSLYQRPFARLPFDRRIEYLLETKRSISGMKNFIDELQTTLEKKMGCALDGGLSASCNHKDAVEAGAHHRFLASSFAPGRRRRRSLKPSPKSYHRRN